MIDGVVEAEMMDGVVEAEMIDGVPSPLEMIACRNDWWGP